MTSVTFTEDVQTDNATGTARNLEIWSAANVSTSDTTIEVDFGGSANSICAALVYTGLASSTPFDVEEAIIGGFNANMDGASATPAEPGTGVTGATLGGDEVWVGAAICETNSVTFSAQTPTGPPATSEVAEISHASGGKIVIWERIFANSSTETANIVATMSAADDYHAAIGVYKGTGSSPRPVILLGSGFTGIRP